MSTMLKARPVSSVDIDSRVSAVDWAGASTHLDAYGWTLVRELLPAVECESIAGLYEDDRRFRSHIVMARHGFGRGEYKYFAYPLPDVVADLRRPIYPNLAPIANRWNESMGIDVRYPAAHADFIARCHKAGQTRPTPLLLQYVAGDYNALHQDLYGEHVFPLQLTILLSEPDQDFTGGEFVLIEQRPRMQSRAEVVPLRRGDAVVFAVHRRPVHGTRGIYRVSPAPSQPITIGSSPHRGRDLSRREMSRAVAEEDTGGRTPWRAHRAIHQDVEKTARLYVETFGMKEVGKVNDPGTRGVFLTDGDINLAILNFRSDVAAGVERGKGFSGREPRRDCGQADVGGRLPPS